jgi:hypothetical protein
MGPARPDGSSPAPPTARGRIPPDVWSISIVSLFADWSYEMILPVVPFFLAFTLGASPFIVGLVDGAAQFAQSGVQTVAGSRWASGTGRKVRGAYGYLTTTIGHGLLAVAVVWPEVLVLRVGAWIGRGSRQPIKKAIVSNATTPESQGIAFGLEQALDSAGAVLGTLTAVLLLLDHGLSAFRTIFAVSVLPGFAAVIILLVFVRDRRAAVSAPAETGGPRPGWSSFPSSFRLFLVAEAVFGLGYFSILLALLRVGENLLPSSGGSAAGAVVAALLLYLLYNLIFAGLSYPVGRGVDRLPGLGFVALSFALFALVDLFLIGDSGLLGGVLAFTAAGVQVSLQGVAESAWVGRKVPASLAGTAYGWLGLIQGMAILAGSLLVGALWTYRTAALAFEVSAILSLAGAAMLLPAFLAGRREAAVPPASPALA